MKLMKFPPSHIVLHTAAFRGPASVEAIREWHLERGFDDIGYHWFISGSFYDIVAPGIYKGRPLDYKGAHPVGNNHTVGVCVSGHGDHMEWTDQQLGMVGVLCKQLMHTYNIPLKKVIGHNETWMHKLKRSKTRPGKLIDMDEVRKHVLNAPSGGLDQYIIH